MIECCNKALVSDYTQMKHIFICSTKNSANICVLLIIIYSMFSFNLCFLQIKDIDDSLNTSILVNDTIYIDSQLSNDPRYLGKHIDDDTISMKEWIQFSQANLFEKYTTRLSMCDI